MQGEDGFSQILRTLCPLDICRVTGGLCACMPMTHRLLLKAAGKPFKCMHPNPYAFIRIQHSFSEQCITIFQTCTLIMCQQRWLVKMSKFTDYPPACAFFCLSQETQSATHRCTYKMLFQKDLNIRILPYLD